MTFKEAYTKVCNGIDRGHYSTIRLVQNPSSKKREVIIPYKKGGGVDLKETMNYFGQKLESLPKGEYAIEAKPHFSASVTDEYKFKSSAKSFEPMSESKDNSEMKIILPGADEVGIRLRPEDYQELIRENEELKAQNRVLLTEVKYYKDKIESGVGSPQNPDGQPLKENTKPGIAELLMKHGDQLGPVLTSGLDELFKYLNRTLDIKQQQQSTQPPPAQGAPQAQQQQPDIEAVVKERVQYFYNLSQEDADQAADEFMKLQDENPLLFNRVREELEKINAQENAQQSAQ